MSLRGRGITERREWLYDQPTNLDDKVVCKYASLVTEPQLTDSVSAAVEDGGDSTEKEITINSGEELVVTTHSMIHDIDGISGVMPTTASPTKELELHKIIAEPLNSKSSENSGESLLLVSASNNNSSEVLSSSSSPASPLVKYVDITDYLNMPQSDAARRLGIPTSTLSKRWKEAARNRKWPFRSVSKLDKEIMTLLHNIPKGADSAQSAVPPPEIQAILSQLLRKRQEELKPVFIRLDVRGNYE